MRTTWTHTASDCSQHTCSLPSQPVLCQACALCQLPSSCDFCLRALLLPLSSFFLPLQACWAGLSLSESQVHLPGQDISSFPRSPRAVPYTYGSPAIWGFVCFYPTGPHWRTLWPACPNLAQPKHPYLGTPPSHQKAGGTRIYCIEQGAIFNIS